MKNIINRFNKGLSKDINKVNFPNDMYYHLQNGRVISDTGNDNFSVVNVEGNAEELFNTTERINSLYPDFVIIGYVTVRDDIVLFLADENNTGSGKIILLKYIGNSYSVFTLYENKDIKFLPGYPIYTDMVTARYESPHIIKIYWTDNNNKLRFLNIAPDEGTNGNSQVNYSKVQSTSLDNLELISKINFTTPVFNSYTSGSLNSGMIQYAYRLYNQRGGESIFSPASELIPLTMYSDANGTQRLKGQSTGGQSVNTNTGKGVIIKIELDTDTVSLFDKIEVISLWYSDKEGIPTISIIDRKDVATTIYVTDEGGVVEYSTVEIEEYQALSYDFICKTLAVKDNRLFVGNIREDYFDVDYDAKAVRYDITPQAEVFDDGGQYKYLYDDANDTWNQSALSSGDPYTGEYILTGTQYLTSQMPEDLDWVNVSNILDYDGLVNEYKYQKDGTILGGEGANISYTFADNVVYKIEDNSDIRTMNTSITDKQRKATINGKEYIVLANRDWIYGSKKAFQRDEIYRFGIVFYDTKGRTSFVKWIGDIRMPSNKDIPATVSNEYGIYVRPLYPIFTVNNIPSVGEKLLDYQIVYVKRNKEDKTIISQGIGSGIIKQNSSVDFYVSPFEITNIKDYINNDYVDPAGDDITEYLRYILEYNSPDVNFDNTFINSPNSRLEIAGGVYTEGTVWRAAGNWNTISITGGDSHQIVRKYSNIKGITVSSVNINELKILTPGAENTNKTILGDYIYNHYVKRFDTHHHGGFRGTSAVINVDGDFNTTNDFGLTSPGSFVFLLNIRNNVIGYNGNTYEDRQTNSYIVAGQMNSPECYNGDTFVCMYDYLRTINDESRDPSTNLQEVIYFPVETQYNLFYRFDDSYHRIKDLDNKQIRYLNEVGYTNLEKGIDFSPLYGEYYDNVYSKVNSSKIFIPKPYNYTENIIYDSVIKYSNLKLNNEERDSWIKFKTNNFNEVNTNYGSISSLVEFNDNIFVFQENGISVAAINRQELVSPDVGVATVLGSGGILDRFDYISTEIGLQGRNKVIKSLQAMYWLDLNKKKVYTYNKGIQSLDDLKGLNSWFDYGLSNNSVMIGIYDSKYSEVLLTFSSVIETSIINESFTKPSCTIKFTSVIPNSKVYLTLNNTEYVFTASNTSNTGVFFKIGSSLSDTINNFVNAVKRFCSPSVNYNVVKIDDGNGSFNVSVNGLVDGLGNLNPKVEATSSSNANPSGGGHGAVGITFQDYSSAITAPNTIFYVDCDAYSVPDKFEIMVGGQDPAVNIVASTHQSNTSILNGSSSNFDPDVSGATPTNPRAEWFIGRSNGVVPTGIAEFEADTGLSVPFNKQQRIWTRVNPGDLVYVRISGTAGTGWRLSAGTVTSAKGSIDVISVSNIEKDVETFPVLSEDSILDATSNGNIISVQDTEYFNLRKNNKYTIGGITNTTIEDVSSDSFTTSSTYPEGDIDLSYYAKYNDNFTVAYNEVVQGFTGFYDFLPELYIKFNKGFFTTIDSKRLWRHNTGIYCEFYGNLYDTFIDIIVADNSSMIKEFNNLEYYSEVYQGSQLVVNETLHSLQVENDYQQSEEVLLYPLSDDVDLASGDTRYRLYTEGNNIPVNSTEFNNLANIRRVIDHWRTAVPRVVIIDDKSVLGDYDNEDYNNDDYFVFVQGTDNGLNQYNRIRSPYCKFRLKFKNEDDRRFILHQIQTLFQPMIV